MFEQARFWQEKGRGDLALNALGRILQSEPNNERALFESARTMVLQGDLANARTFELRLNQVAPNSSLAIRLRTELKNAKLDQDLIRDARAAAAAGDVTKAVEAYEKVFAEGDADGALAVEYFHTLSGLEDRWQEARVGLGDIVARQPENLDAAIAYIDVLSYREETRRTAVEAYLKLVEAGQGGEVPLEHLRRALLWMGASASDQNYFDAYLELRPADLEIREKWQEALSPSSTDPFSAERSLAYGDLDNGDPARAEKRFKALLQEQPGDAETVAGLGIVRLRQGRYAEADKLLARAIELSPDLTEPLGEARHAARFWLGMKEAGRAAARGQFAQAQSLVNKLEPRSKSERVEANIMLAQIAATSGDRVEAQRRFKAALALDPRNQNAFAGLISGYMAANNAGEVQRLLNKGEAKSVSGKEARAKLFLAKAWLAERQGKRSDAAASYRSAIAYTPNDPWLLLKAARFFANSGHASEAQGIAADLKRLETPEGRHATAIYYSEQDNWTAAIASLQQIPSDTLSAEHRALLARAEMRLQIRRLVQGSSPADRSQTSRQLVALYETAEQGDGTVHVVSAALIQIGSLPTASRVLRQDLQAPGRRPASYLVRSARLLTSANDSQAARRVLDSLRVRQTELDPAERREVAEIYDSLIVKLARRAITNGNYDLAAEYLRPAYAGDPENTEVLRALGELSQKTGRTGDALEFYSQAMQIDPQDGWAIKGAVGAALALRKFREAGRILDVAIAQNPDNPELYFLVSQAAEAAGDIDTAIEAREMAKSLRNRRARSDVSPSLSRDPFGDSRPIQDVSPHNPFRNAGPISFMAGEPPVPGSRGGQTSRRAETRKSLSYEAEPGAQDRLIHKASYTFVGDEAPPLQLAQWAQTEQPEQPAALAGDVQRLTSDDLQSALEAEMAETRLALEAEKQVARSSGVSLGTSSGAIVSAPTSVLVQLAKMLVDQKDYANAEPILAALVHENLSAKDKALVTDLRVQSDIALTKLAFAEGNEAEALDRLKRLGAEQRFNPEVMKLFGQYSDAKGDDVQAVAFYEEAIELAPRDIDARLGAAANLLDIGELTKAEKIVDEGLSSDPHIAGLHFLRGQIKKAQGDLGGAMAAFTKAQQISSGQPSTAEASAPASIAEREAPATPLGVERDTAKRDTSYDFAGLLGEASEPPAAELGAPAQGQVSPSRIAEPRPHQGQGTTAATGQPYEDYSFDFTSATADTSRQANADEIRSRLRNLGAPQNTGDREPSYQMSFETPATASDPAPSEIDWQLEDLKNQRGVFFGPKLQFRWREGEEGLSQLTEFVSPFEIDFRPGAGRLNLSLVPTFISAGTFNDDPFLLRRFGTFSLVTPGSRYAPDADAAAGIGFGVGYSVGGLSLGVGTTPIGFEVMNVLGNARFAHYFSSGFGFEIEAGRKSVTDSVLSFAGAEDPLTGENFGGIVENFGRIALSQDFGKAGVYLNGRYGITTGDRTENNTVAAGDIGFFAMLLDREGHTVKSGFNVSYFGYEKNQRFFTLGHGGYFSPQTFIGAGVPVSYGYNTQRLSVKLAGGVGVQYFSEDRTPYFPDRPDLQLALSLSEAASLNPQPVFYDAERKTALGLNGNGEFVYKLTPSLHMSGGLGIDRAADWTEVIGHLRVRYWPGSELE